MPNDCFNSIKLVGSKETLDEIEKSKFSFKYFIPPPEDATQDWFIDNWCADREARVDSMTRECDDTLYVVCNTAWTVPIGFLKKLIEKFPELYIFNQYSIEYTDCGIVILYMKDCKIMEREFRWFDPAGLDYVKGVRDGDWLE